MSTMPEKALNNLATESRRAKPMNIPFNIPFNNDTTLGSVLPPSFECGSLFKGRYASKVHQFFKEKYGAQEVVLTASCTNALELAALLLDLKKGDEVIIPAYTYVSTANAFELRGARLRLCDSAANSPNIDLQKLEALLTPKTKAIVVIHYAGISVDMYRLKEIAQKHNVFLIEDAAHAIDAYYDSRRLGSFGDLSTFSFHETKNVTSGQGGVLLINNAAFVERARILRDCGTNRHNFHLGLVDKYTWIDVGSVFNLSELCCAYLYPQLANIELITQKRIQLWNNYRDGLARLANKGLFQLPFVENRCEHNAHIFYIILKSRKERDRLLLYLKERGIVATFHYSGLHQCPYYQGKYKKTKLPYAEICSGNLLRLPLYFDLSFEQQAYILECIGDYFEAPKRRRHSANAYLAIPLYLNPILEEGAMIANVVKSIFPFIA
ncbi:MAG: dTDP-4-amino-4,6-dideoxygalactose transaminase [Thermoanaerobaculia bacterium]|nr:dTDP-4-amino-4,6-dideoxygalactose transaminase [Thermoanaerobaculia bacterium]